MQNVAKTRKSHFVITEFDDLKLYLGIEVSLESGLYYLSQEEYIDRLLKVFNLENETTNYVCMYAKISPIAMDPGYLKQNSTNLLGTEEITPKSKHFDVKYCFIYLLYDIIIKPIERVKFMNIKHSIDLI